MNTELKRLMSQAEGRYPSESELSALRAYASGIAARLEVAQRVRQAEDQIVAKAMQRMEAQMADYLAQHKIAREKSNRDFRLILRSAVSGMVRDDLPYFREVFGDWSAELLCSVCPPREICTAFLALRSAVEETLEPSDYRPLRPFLDAFIAELEKWN